MLHLKDLRTDNFGQNTVKRGDRLQVLRIKELRERDPSRVFRDPCGGRMHEGESACHNRENQNGNDLVSAIPGKHTKSAQEIEKAGDALQSGAKE